MQEPRNESEGDEMWISDVGYKRDEEKPELIDTWEQGDVEAAEQGTNKASKYEEEMYKRRNMNANRVIGHGHDKELNQKNEMGED